MFILCPAINVADAQPSDPHILALPYSKPRIRLTRSVYDSNTPIPALNVIPTYKPPRMEPTKIFQRSIDAKPRKNGPERISNTAITNNKFFLSPNLS